MPHCRCGKVITTGRQYCSTCSLVKGHGVDTDHDGAEYDCPECGGPTSGEGAVCYKCRGGGGE